MKLGKCPVGSEVVLRGRVLQQKPGQTLCWFPGVGGNGEWSLVSTAEVEVENAEEMLEQVMMDQAESVAHG